MEPWGNSYHLWGSDCVSKFPRWEKTCGKTERRHELLSLSVPNVLPGKWNKHPLLLKKVRSVFDISNKKHPN